jgi:hypothetical protein
MMRRRKMLCVTAVAGLLAGCNQPAVSLKLPATQSSENTIRDWNDVAHAIASGMAAKGLLPNPGQPPQTIAPAPVFVRVRAPDSTFVRQVADALESDVLASGGTIARTPDGATVINLDVTIVKWGPRDKPPGLLGTTAALLTVPAIVLGDSLPMATWTAADGFGAAIAGLGILADGIIAMTPTMNAEAVWDATVITGDRILMRLREPVYIREADIPLYAKRITLARVPSWERGTPLQVRTIRYDP